MSNIDDFEAIVELESQSYNKNEFANLDFSIPTLNAKPKKLPLVIKLLQNLPNGKSKIADLPNGRKAMGGVAPSTPPPAKSVYDFNFCLYPMSFLKAVCYLKCAFFK